MAVMVDYVAIKAIIACSQLKRRRPAFYDPPLRELRSDLTVSGWIVSTIKLAFR
jgi:hypothetical protein